MSEEQKNIQNLIDKSLINPKKVLMEDGRYFHQGEEVEFIFKRDKKALIEIAEKVSKEITKNRRFWKFPIVMASIALVSLLVSCFYYGRLIEREKWVKDLMENPSFTKSTN